MWPDPNALDVARAQIDGLESEVQALRHRVTQLEEKHGRAVAALQEAHVLLGRFKPHELGPEWQPLLRAFEIIDKALADATATQAADVWRAQQEARAMLIKSANAIVDAFSGFDKPTWPVGGILLRNLILALRRAGARKRDESDPGMCDEAFTDGAQAAREMLARFVEQGEHPEIAMSIRANWHPGWGTDPGAVTDEIPTLAKVDARREQSIEQLRHKRGYQDGLSGANPTDASAEYTEGYMKGREELARRGQGGK